MFEISGGTINSLMHRAHGVQCTRGFPKRKCNQRRAKIKWRLHCTASNGLIVLVLTGFFSVAFAVTDNVRIINLNI